MKKIFSLLLSVIFCLCFAGCNAVNQLLNDILRWGATVPPSAPPTWTYYGVVETWEESDGLFVYIDGVGLCDIPAYEKEAVEVKEGDLLMMDFNTDEVEIMECFPARFGAPADYMGVIEFDFSLTWGTFGISSYDSKTGRLVKTDDVSNVEDFTTTYFLTPREKLTIYKTVRELNMTSYPEEYNPTAGIGSNPYQTLILSVEINATNMKITANEVALGDATSEKGQRFMDACNTISDILENTEEWKALPDYPYLYD
ncbi:MAG: hypothetical protein J6S04_01010 [Clostridia bacterium]|nr:hypothetical protein [Clostridia bacterium]